MQERIDAMPYDAERFLDDIRRTASLLDAPFAEDATRTALQIFDEEFRSCVVQMKAVCKEDSGVYYRFFYNGPNDLTERALTAGLLGASDPDSVWLQSEVLEAFPGATRAGLDFDSGFGLAKVWTFTGGPVPVEQLCKLSCMPRAVREHLGFFADHGLRNVFFVASDYQGSTMNVYFGWDEGCRTVEWIQNLAEAAGGAAPGVDVCEQILRSQANAGGVGMTFSWDSPRLLRWCLYSLEVPAEELQNGEIALPDRLQKFLDAPTQNSEPQYNVAWSFGGEQPYMKVEKSYARDATFFLTHEMGGDLARPTVGVA